MVRSIVLAVVMLGSAPAYAQFGEIGFPIVNGKQASTAQLYGTVAIINSGDNSQICTGTLVAPTIVVTAAHCFYDFDNQTQIETPDSIEIVAGVLTTASTPDANRYAVTKLVYHGGFPAGGTTDDNFFEIGMGRTEDVALVIIERPVTGVTVMPILPAELTDQVFVTDAALIITGYGTTDLEGQSNAGVLYIAESVYRGKTSTEFWGGKKSSSTPCDSDDECGTGEVCIAKTCQATDTCSGDSGGPVYVDVNGTVYLAGVVSRGVANGTTYCGEGGIYTMASFYVQWLTDNSDGAYPPITSTTPDNNTDTVTPGDDVTQGGSDAVDPSDSSQDTSSEKKSGGSSCSIGPGGSPVGAPLLLLILIFGLLRRRSLEL